MAESILRRYNFRLYPNRIQSAEMDTMRRMHCTLYNAALQQRIDAYRLAGVSLTFFTQGLDLKTIRADDPAYAALSADSLRGTLQRLDLAYQAFYRRAKAGAGKESGFPKYKRSDDYPGFWHRHGYGWKLSLAPRARKGTMTVKGVTGPIALRGKFPGPPISVRTCDIKLHGGTWWASIAVELPARMRAEQQHSGEITFDLVDHFARVRRVNGGHAAGPEDTVYAAADGRIFPVFEGGIPHQADSSDEHQRSVGSGGLSGGSRKAESSDEHQWSVGMASAATASSLAESSDETAGSVGWIVSQKEIAKAESSDEHQRSVGRRSAASSTAAESSDESGGSVGTGRCGRAAVWAESSDESGGSVGSVSADGSMVSAESSDEHQVSVGNCTCSRAGSEAESSDEHQGSVGQWWVAAESSVEHRESVGVRVVRAVSPTAESSDESQGSVGHKPKYVCAQLAESPDERRESVGWISRRRPMPRARSSDEHRESVGEAVDAEMPAEAESPCESGGSVGSPTQRGLEREAGSPDESGGSVGAKPTLRWTAGVESPDENQETVGERIRADRLEAAESPDETGESVGARLSGQETVGSLAQVRDINSGNLCLAAGSPPKTQETVGAGARRNSETVGAGASVKDLQRGMAKCKRGSRRYRYRRRIKAKREARVARQRRESLHVWSTTLVRRYASLVIIKPPLVEATQSGAGTEREPGAAVGLKAEVNRHVLDQAPGLAISMLEYKLAERGGTAKIIETRAAPVLAGNLIVAATKANRKLKRTAKRA